MTECSLRNWWEKKICADYISGWHTGIDKYLLAFNDGSSDLISEEDIEGVEMKLVDESIVDGSQKRSKRVNYAALNSGDLDD